MKKKNFTIKNFFLYITKRWNFVLEKMQSHRTVALGNIYNIETEQNLSNR